MGYSNITLSFLVTCAEYWYGPDCNRWCQESTCMCDLPVPCHDNCLGVACGENRYCVDGVDVYVCTCDRGFTGRWCEINVDECEGVNCSGNGRCIDGVDSFYCDCAYGYYGPLCEYTKHETNGNGRGITNEELGNHTHTHTHMSHNTNNRNCPLAVAKLNLANITNMLIISYCCTQVQIV